MEHRLALVNNGIQSLFFFSAGDLHLLKINGRREAQFSTLSRSQDNIIYTSLSVVGGSKLLLLGRSSWGIGEADDTKSLMYDLRKNIWHLVDYVSSKSGHQAVT